MPRPKLRVRPGLNVWRLIRSDRDGAKREDLPQHAAAAVRYFLGLGLSPQANQQLVPTSKNEWRFDDVRPLQVVEISRKAGPAMPPGQLLADRMHVARTVPTVSGQKPWWILVRFWWRGPPLEIDYPAVRQGMLWPAWDLDAADWVLDRAVFVPREDPSAPADPGPATWTEALGDKAQAAFLRATDDLGDFFGRLGSGIGILALLYLLAQSRRK